MRAVRRKRQRANLDFAGLGVEGQIHLAAPPMVAAIGTEPHTGAHRPHTDRELLSHRSHLARSMAGTTPRRAEDLCSRYIPRPAFARHQLSFGGFFSSSLRGNSAIPAATLRPFWPSIETGCNAIDFLNPPTRALAPAPTPSATLAVTPP